MIGVAMDEKTKRTLEEIFMAGLKAVDPEEAIRRHVQLTGDHLKVGEHVYPLASFERIIVTGFGKGTAPMAKALEEILGDRLTEGWITVKYGHGLPLKKVRVMEAGHPIPDQAGLQATRFLLDRLKGCTEKDLVLCAFSGGGSALSPAPRAPLELGEKQETTQLLLNCGATIFELNAMRKHLSLCKGGQLARIAFPATLVSLFLSDVVGDPLDVIASGPTVPDPSTFSDCIRIVDRYGLREKLPPAVLKLLQDGAKGLIADTPKAGDAVFKKGRNLVVGSNRAALLAAAAKGRSARVQHPDSLILCSGRGQGDRPRLCRNRKRDRGVGSSHPAARMYSGRRRDHGHHPGQAGRAAETRSWPLRPHRQWMGGRRWRF